MSQPFKFLLPTNPLCFSFPALFPQFSLNSLACVGSSAVHNLRCNLTVLVGFGVIGQQCAAVSPYLEWNNIPEKECAIVLNCMRRGWIDLGNTAIGYAQ